MRYIEHVKQSSEGVLPVEAGVSLLVTPFASAQVEVIVAVILPEIYEERAQSHRARPR